MPMSEQGRKIWADEIETAKRRIKEGTAENGSILTSDFNISVDPEDFIRLIDGVWDSNNQNP